MTEQTSEPTTENVKPCPWCGTQPLIEPWHGGGPDKHMVSCDNEDCAAGPKVTGENRIVAIALWNERVPVYEENLNIDDMERRHVIAAFKRFKGNRTQMSEALGIAYRTLCGKLRSYGYGPRENPAEM